jgi:hypothetical protein
MGDVKGKPAPGYAELKTKDPVSMAQPLATYAVLMQRNAADRVRYVEEARVSIRRDQPHTSPMVDVDTHAPASTARDKLVDTIVAQYTELSTYSNTQEVSQTLVRAVRDVCSGLTLKGGVYLVRPEHLASLTSLQEFIARDCDGALELWEIRETTANARTAQRNARTSLRAAFDELMTEIATFRAENTDPTKVMAKSVNAKVREFRELDAKVALYADVLGSWRDELAGSIAKAKTEFLTAYLGDDADDAAA